MHGLTSEAGEVSGKYAKAIRAGVPVDRQAVALELGDVLFMVARLSALLGFSLEEIAHMNIEKLTARQARGTINGEGDNR